MDIYKILLIILMITLMTGILYGIFVLLESRKKWPAHPRPYGFILAKTGLMGNRQSSRWLSSRLHPSHLLSARENPLSVIDNETSKADFSDKW